MHLLRLALPTDQDGLVTRSGAVRVGLDDRELSRLVRAEVLVRLRRGVYVDGERWRALDPFRGQPLLRVRAAQLSLQCDHVLSHDSAALVLGLGVPDARRSIVHITRPKVHGDAVRAGVKHHLAPYRPSQVEEIDRFRLLDRARTALDMAREHGLVAGVACCDRALRLGTTRAELDAARAAMWCWPGSSIMDLSLDLADPGAESWLESAGRVLVHSLGAGRPETQFGLTDGHRSVWCDLRLDRHVFEVDGWLKYEPDGEAARQVLQQEKLRQDFLGGFKLGVSRITVTDCGSGWEAARQRLAREYSDTCARFGTDVRDLAPYRIRRRAA